jgi:uncharacterized membrane protein
MNSRVPTNKWLFASVAINLLFIGALTGEWVSQSRRAPPPMHWATGELDESTRSSIKKMLMQQAPAARSLRREMKAIDQRLMTVARAEDVDTAELTAILSDRQAKQAQYQALLQASIESIFPALTPPQREAVIRRMLIEGKSRHPAHPKRGGEHRNQPRPDDRPATPR